MRLSFYYQLGDIGQRAWTPPLHSPRDRDLRDQPLPVKKNESALPDSPASQTQKTYTRKVCVQLQKLCFCTLNLRFSYTKQEKCAPAALWVRFAAPSKKGLPVPSPAPALPNWEDSGGQVRDASPPLSPRDRCHTT